MAGAVLVTAAAGAAGKPLAYSEGVLRVSECLSKANTELLMIFFSIVIASDR